MTERFDRGPHGKERTKKSHGGEQAKNIRRPELVGRTLFVRWRSDINLD